MKRIALVSVVSVALFAAPAYGQTIKSEIIIGGVSAGGGTVSTEGHVDSKRDACLSDREISFSIEVSGSTTALQKDVSSRNGYAGGSGEGATFPHDVIAKMKPKQLSGNLRCAGNKTRQSEQRRALFAPRETIAGTFQYNNLSYAGSEIGATGFIESGKRCLAGRRVETFPFDDGESKPARGHDISSRNGYWGVFAKSNSQGVGLRLTSEEIGGGDRCGGDVYRYDPDPN